MADHNEAARAAGDEEEQSNYQRPKPKPLNEILNSDVEDESLRKYKESLGLTTANSKDLIVFPNDPRHIIVQKLAIVVDGRPDIEVNLTGDISQLKKKSIVMKEGVKYRVKIYFYCQREIVSGLKYVQKISKVGLQVGKETHMVGSYGPGKDLKSYQTPWEEAPSGMLARGTYTLKSLFTDDDDHEYLKWEWSLDIKKDWN